MAFCDITQLFLSHIMHCIVDCFFQHRCYRLRQYRTIIERPRNRHAIGCQTLNILQIILVYLRYSYVRSHFPHRHQLAGQWRNIELSDNNAFNMFDTFNTFDALDAISHSFQTAIVQSNSPEFLSPLYARARCVALLYLLRITKLPRLVNRFVTHGSNVASIITPYCMLQNLHWPSLLPIYNQNHCGVFWPSMVSLDFCIIAGILHFFFSFALQMFWFWMFYIPTIVLCCMHENWAPKLFQAQRRVHNFASSGDCISVWFRFHFWRCRISFACNDR